MNTKTINSLRLESVLAQASSLSVLLYGDAGEVFRDLEDTDQDNILWLLSGLVNEASQIVSSGGAHG